MINFKKNYISFSPHVYSTIFFIFENENKCEKCFFTQILRRPNGVVLLLPFKPVHHRRSLQRKRVESEHGAHSLGPLASAGEFQLQRIGGVHSSGPLENSQDRPRRH